MTARTLALVLTCASVLPVARAQSGLQPDANAAWGASDYDLVLNSLFGQLRLPVSPGGHRDFCFDDSRMLLITSFRPERFVAVCRFETGYATIAAEPERSLWYIQSDLEPDSGDRVGQVLRAANVTWDFAPIDSAFAGEIGDLWSRAIRSASYPEAADLGTDGESSYFRRSPLGSLVDGHFPAAVTATAPNARPETVAGALQALGLRIMGYARGEATVDDLRADAEALRARLDALDR